MAYVCPKDSTHQSEDADYCSVCGTKINAAPLSAAPSAPARLNLNDLSLNSPSLDGAGTGGSGEVCPDCGLARHAGAKFCEVCRYNFETHSSASPAAPLAPVADLTPDPAPLTMPDIPADTPAAAAVPGAFRSWEARVVVDPSLYVEPDSQVPCPVGEPERLFPLDLAENLIGRRSDRRDIHPEVPLSDVGVSHRHAKILRQPDGGLILLDVGSTNGTELNGVEVLPGVQTPLQDGDQITLGCWTRMTVRRV